MKDDNKKTIFICEDDSMMLEIYSKGFSLEGFNTMIARDGEEAKGILEKGAEKPSVFLLDIMMPKSNGFELLEYIKSRPDLKDTPTVFLTNIFSKDDIDKAKQLGVDLYLVKSENTPQELVEKVRTFIKEK